MSPGPRSVMLIVAWVLLACVSAGLVAESLAWPSLWGGGSIFWGYALPFWLGYGMLHVPGLVVGAIALAIASRRRAGLLLVALALGALAAAALSTWDVQFQQFRRSPFALYLAIDAVWLSLFAAFLRAPDAPPVGKPLVAAAFALPILVALASQWTTQRHFETWRPAVSEWDERANLETFDLYPSAHRPLPQSADEGCAILERLAPNPYPESAVPGGWPKRHRILRLYGDPLDARRPGDGMPAPVLSYEWWPDRETGSCDRSSFAAAR